MVEAVSRMLHGCNRVHRPALCGLRNSLLECSARDVTSKEAFSHGYSDRIVFVFFHKDTALKNAVKSVGDQRAIGSIPNASLKAAVSGSAPAVCGCLL